MSLYPPINVLQPAGHLGSGVLILNFYSENSNVTDELRALIETLRTRLVDRFGSSRGAVPPIILNGLGQPYELSESIQLGPDFCGLFVDQFNLIADPGASAWSDPAHQALLVFGTETGSPPLIVNSGARYNTFTCNRVTNAISAANTNNLVLLGNSADEFKDFGIRAWKKNRAIEIAGGKLQEWGSADAVGQVYANRTAYGLWLEKSDGSARNVVMPCCKRGLFVDNIRNFLFDGIHPWMGSLSNEADRFAAYCVEIGDTLDIAGEDTQPSGLQFSACYFDHGPVLLRSFPHQFDTCTWTGGETGIYPFVAEATSANEQATGWKVVDARISQEHNRAFVNYTTSGSGSWATRKLFQYSVLSAGSSEILQNKLMSSLWLFETGTNGKSLAAGGTYNDQTHVQLSEAPTEIPIGSLSPNFSVHSAYGGKGFSASFWGTGAVGTVIAVGRSRSTTPGTFGVYLNDGDVIFRLTATGDQGTNFGSGNKPGSQFDVIADGNHSSGNTPTKLRFGTTPAGSTGDAVARWDILANGALAPASDNAVSVGQSNKVPAEAFSYSWKVKTKASASASVANIGEIWFDGTNVKFTSPAGVTKTFTLV